MLPGARLATEEVDPMRMGSDQHPTNVPEGSFASADQTPDIEDAVSAHPKADSAYYLALLIDFQTGVAHGTFTISNSGL